MVGDFLGVERSSDFGKHGVKFEAQTNRACSAGLLPNTKKSVSRRRTEKSNLFVDVVAFCNLDNAGSIGWDDGVRRSDHYSYEIESSWGSSEG